MLKCHGFEGKGGDFLSSYVWLLSSSQGQTAGPWHTVLRHKRSEISRKSAEDARPDGTEDSATDIFQCNSCRRLGRATKACKWWEAFAARLPCDVLELLLWFVQIDEGQLDELLREVEMNEPPEDAPQPIPSDEDDDDEGKRT